MAFQGPARAQAEGDPKRTAVSAWSGVTGPPVCSNETGGWTSWSRERRGWAVLCRRRTEDKKPGHHQQRPDAPVGLSPASAHPGEVEKGEGGVVRAVHLNIFTGVEGTVAEVS